MILKFKTLILHNFLSYGHAELDLTNKHYCLVTGENNYKSDNAISNGSGKSSWSSAICWALTGETIQGLSTNIKNINVDENLCYVEITFFADSDLFKIRRYKNPKSDLKIELNGCDISGKGIRESEDILSRYLPDLTSQLIASIIILGQGLPNKFTANTPSGRKEVLEKLSKSDFMIQDLKSRISARQDDLSKQLREKEDIILSTSTKVEYINRSISQIKQTLETLDSQTSFDITIFNLEKKLSKVTLDINDSKEALKKYSDMDSVYAEEYISKLDLRDTETRSENSEFEEFKSEYLQRRAQILGQIQSITARIDEYQKIRDICPTCGQKIPNVIKPDISADLIALDAVKTGLKELDEKFNSAETQHNQILQEIYKRNSDRLSELSQLSKKLKDDIRNLNDNIQRLQHESMQIQTDIAKTNLEKNEYKSKRQRLESELKAYIEELKEYTESISKLSCDKDNILARIKIVNQLNTAVKRDFRGYLLSEIISFIESKSKEFCDIVFGNSNIEFKLNGNNIDISYCGKCFENLSGGEKQRIDLIIQFAIRNMMEHYLNFSSNILVLDEIFDQLDSVGCDNIINLINKNLADIESIFIISHRADELEIPSDYELIVTKNEQGVSTLVCR